MQQRERWRHSGLTNGTNQSYPRFSPPLLPATLFEEGGADPKSKFQVVNALNNLGCSERYVLDRRPRPLDLLQQRPSVSMMGPANTLCNDTRDRTVPSVDQSTIDVISGK